MISQLYHRQLSLQNVFITKNKTIRIGNFSLARTGQNDQVYKGVTAWEMSMTHRAPETFDEKNYTDRSDVWSLGVCYYELFSLGNTPYEKEVNGNMTEKEYLDFVRSGGRLEKPEYCGSEIYAQVKKCWLSEPFSRPTFGHYVEFFEDHSKKMDAQIFKQMNAKLEEAYNYQQSLEDSIGRSSENDNFDVEYNALPVL
uniref:Protein kinase domain-containing protein n=1 Tax=Caenorhabditis tropicalis TaxID=1561998 RepID=A0A1I7U9Q7_9PELO